MPVGDTNWNWRTEFLWGSWNKWEKITMAIYRVIDDDDEVYHPEQLQLNSTNICYSPSLPSLRLCQPCFIFYGCNLIFVIVLVLQLFLFPQCFVWFRWLTLCTIQLCNPFSFLFLFSLCFFFCFLFFFLIFELREVNQIWQLYFSME